MDTICHPATPTRNRHPLTACNLPPSHLLHHDACPFYLFPLSTPPPHLHLQFTVSLHAPTLSHLNCTIPVDLVSSPPPLRPAPQVIPHRVAKGTLQKRPSGFPHPPKMGPNSSKALLSWSLTSSSAPSFPAIHLTLWVSATLSSLMCLEGSWHSAHCLCSYLNTLLAAPTYTADLKAASRYLRQVQPSAHASTAS